MFGFFKAIDYTLKARKGIKDSGGLVTDLSFGPLEGLFILSFIILGVLTIGLGFLGIHFDSGIAVFFSVFFLLILFVDIVIFKKVKSIFERAARGVVDYSKKKYKSLSSDKIIDVDYE